MKRFLIYLSVASSVLAAVSLSYAQDTKQDAPPMTPEQKERAILAHNGQLKPTYTSEQIAEYNRKEETYLKSLTAARALYRQGRYTESANAYNTIEWGNFHHNRWETAEAYRAAGQTEQAIKWYRLACYQKVKLGSVRGYDLTPRAQLPVGTTSIDEARRRFPEKEIEVWSENDTAKLGYFALLLEQHGDIAEAVAVYQEAFRTLCEPIPAEWQTVLSLGNISASNFDQRRFESAVYTMMAAKGASLDWIQFKYEKPTGDNDTKERQIWIEEAVRIKPDYAPALYIKAKQLALVGDAKTQAEYAAAKQCLAQAEQCARSEDLRALIQKLRNDYPSRLR